MCTEEQQDKLSGCAAWKGQGFCDSGSMYYQFMQANCFATCGGCESKRKIAYIKFLNIEFYLFAAAMVIN